MDRLPHPRLLPQIPHSYCPGGVVCRKNYPLPPPPPPHHVVVQQNQLHGNFGWVFQPGEWRGRQWAVVPLPRSTPRM